MQDTKDTFYVALRDRVAAGNPGRTVVVRGVTRPGVLVEENELPSGFVPADVFWVRWTDVTVDRAGAAPLVALTCSIRYGTDGDAGAGGMDRGRLLGAMDAELAAALGAGLQGTGVRNVKKTDYRNLVGSSGTGAGATLGTNVFWGDVTFGPAVMAGERLERVATVLVFGFCGGGGLMASIDVGMVGRRVRGFFAPVNRGAGAPAIFDPAALGRFALGDAPEPWVDLGWCAGFKRVSGSTVADVLSGAPASVSGQVRTQLDARVSFAFETWGRLQVALAAGSQSMNLLKPARGAAAGPSGGLAEAAVPLEAGSTATALVVGVDAAAGFGVGDLVAVDVDYAGQIGFVGSGVSAAYVRSAALVGSDSNYVRRVTLNVGRVASVQAGTLELEGALLAGAPATGMQVSPMVGFCDREGGSFFAEWSAVFCMDGEQGDRVIFHYPRLQAIAGADEVTDGLGGGLERLRLAGAFPGSAGGGWE